MSTKLTIETVVRKALADANSVIDSTMSKTASASPSGAYKTELAQHISKLAESLRAEATRGVTYEDVHAFARNIRGEA